MCGIVGAVNGSKTAEDLVSGLKRLEYRGYDSSGIAVLNDLKIESRKSVGKLENLIGHLSTSPCDGAVGIAHTRWATHGKPNTANAHPHVFGNVAVVHNGIIENFRKLREELSADGHVFESETDTEVIPHLIQAYLAAGKTAEAALEMTLGRLEGSYAIAALVNGEDGTLLAARRGSPLVIGHGEGTNYIASDGLALGPLANELTYLEEGDWAVIDAYKADIRDATGKSCTRGRAASNYTATAAGKNGFRHYMLKEIHEQPAVIRRVLQSYLCDNGDTSTLPFHWAELPRLSIVGCGTSSYAAQIAKYWFEELARLPVDVDIASEFRYRATPFTPGGAALFISQSGETADTLAALRHAAIGNQSIISLVNVAESSMARESDAVLHTHAGPEIGVASTKAFTAQLTALACLVIEAVKERGTQSDHDIVAMEHAVTCLPLAVEQILEQTDDIEAIATSIARSATSAMFMGRGTAFPLAMEGALKLKEISYVHAEGFGAGELKHGPIALVDENMPVIVIAPRDALFDKTVSNLQEVKARSAQVFAVTDTEGANAIRDEVDAIITTPAVHPFTAPIVMAVPLQLLAYHVAILKGTDVDQPRNLAKSVTVE